MAEPTTHHIVIEVSRDRRRAIAVIAVLILFTMLVLATVALASRYISPLSTATYQTVPPVVSFQGRVTAQGQPFNGVGFFKFAVVDTSGSITYWSNDGTSNNGSQPNNPVLITVTNGLFTVLLGDTSLNNMTALSSTVFIGTDRSLRIWFSTSAVNYEQLAPDIRISAAPFALNAEMLDGLDSTALLLHSQITSTVSSVGDSRYARLSPNPKQIALFKWYTAISTTQSTFPVGNGPRDVAFDGENVWVTNRDSGTVSVLRASNGAPVGTYVTSGPPGGIAYDGVNMWVVGNIDPGTISVFRARDGSPITTLPVAPWPSGIAFDGTNMWVAGGAYDVGNLVQVLRASDGFKVMTLTVGTGATGIAFDGTNMWVTNRVSATVSVLRASDGFHVMTPTVGGGPAGVAFDGERIWVTNQAEDTVSVLRAVDGTHVMTLTVGPTPTDIAYDGVNIWVANQNSNYVTILRASDGATIMTSTVGLHPVGFGFDGANMWVANLASNSVSKR